ncbi:hypothetical protein L7F22_067642 [Adiantum nelumboides]|nr:hypothetical protein [Adiantum nelumboides]
MHTISDEQQKCYAASLASTHEAQRRISPFVHVTPVLSSTSLNQLAGTNLYFKCELFQKGGAFKFRGACNAVLSLPQNLASKGVITHSSGQGTVALELLEQIPELDVIVVPISAKAINPNVKIFAAEPKGADDAAQSKAAGKLILPTHTHTVADGLRACLGSLTWPVVRDKVDEVVTVTEEEIVSAMQMCYEILKVVVEPSGAVGLAAVLSTQFQSSVCKQTFQHVGIVLSGGNVDLGDLGEYFKDSSKIPKKEIENVASNEDTYREIGDILFEARIKANQLEPAGWLATASHCHKLARASVTKGRKTLYCPDTKEWLPMTTYEQQMIVKEPYVLKQIAVYRIVKKQTAAQAMEAATSTQRPVQPKEKKPLDKDKGKLMK